MIFFMFDYIMKNYIVNKIYFLIKKTNIGFRWRKMFYSIKN